MSRRSNSLRALAEAIGMAAVIASLVFVGLELRQNSESTRAAAAQQLATTWIEWNTALVDREPWEAVHRLAAIADPADFPPIDRDMVAALMRSQFQNWANSHYLQAEGILDPAFWDAAMREMRCDLACDPGWGRLVVWAWEHNRYLYPRDFQILFDGLVSSTPRPHPPAAAIEGQES